MWVNLSALLIQAFLVSRMLKYGGFATILFLTPLVSLFSYSMMALFPFLTVIRIMKVAENSANYSVNNTARHVLWLPLPPAMIYKAKTAIDTLFMRTGDGLAALTVLAGTQFFVLPLNGFLAFNVALALIWGGVAWVVVKENRRLARASSGIEKRAF
jgi:AAA family ATP:ADP antiporter